MVNGNPPPLASPASESSGEEVQDASVLASFIRDRMSLLGINRGELVRRMGYRKVKKGLKRLEAFEAGDLTHVDTLLDSLASVLEVPVDEVRVLIQPQLEARERLREEEERAREEQERAREAALRAAFRPHARLTTERDRPSSIIGAMAAVPHLKIMFPDTLPPGSYVSYVLERDIPEKLPAFGRVTGFVVHYTYDHRVTFGLDGTPVSPRSASDASGS